MNIKPSRLYKNLAKSKKSKVNLIKYASIELWNRIGLTMEFQKKIGFMRIYEVTLTQNLVYELCKFQYENSLSLVNLYEAKDEKTNGTDILVYINFPQGTLIFPFQAKLLTTFKEKKDGSYKSFWHKNENGLQIDLLKAFANDLGSQLGFYLFYNHTSGNKNINEKEEFYGCSYISTHALEKSTSRKKNIKFSKIHPKPAKPFYHFFKDDGDSDSSYDDPSPLKGISNEVIDFFAKQGMDVDEEFISTLRFYTQEEIAEQNIGWNKISMNDPDKNQNFERHKTSNDYDVFNPKYKLILAPSVTSLDFEDYLNIEDDGDQELTKITNDEHVVDSILSY